MDELKNNIQVKQTPVKQFSLPTGTHTLVLHNDDYNEFTWVINCLMDLCKHNLEQAEQCALITHNNGKCEIKIGSEEELKKIKTELVLRHLIVTLEKN